MDTTNNTQPPPNIGAIFDDLVMRKKKAALPSAMAVEVTLRQLRADAKAGRLDSSAVEQWIAGNAVQIAQATLSR
jgi:hypothetical protein